MDLKIFLLFDVRDAVSILVEVAQKMLTSRETVSEVKQSNKVISYPAF